MKRLSEKSKEEEGGDGGASSGDGDESSPGSESAWSPSETERLRDGIKAAISCLVPYKSHWPHVRIDRFSISCCCLACIGFYGDVPLLYIPGRNPPLLLYRRVSVAPSPPSSRLKYRRWVARISQDDRFSEPDYSAAQTVTTPTNDAD